jgi:hypothetical protein
VEQIPHGVDGADKVEVDPSWLIVLRARPARRTFGNCDMDGVGTSAAVSAGFRRKMPFGLSARSSETLNHDHPTTMS